MRQGDEIRMLKDIHRICDVQQMGAAFEVERASGRVRDLERRHEVESGALQASHEGWRQSISGASFQLAASAAWAAEILSHQKAVEETRIEVRDAQTEVSRLLDVRTALSARRDAVADLTRQAERLEQRRHDEAALEEHTGRTTSGWRLA